MNSWATNPTTQLTKFVKGHKPHQPYIGALKKDHFIVLVFVVVLVPGVLLFTIWRIMCQARRTERPSWTLFSNSNIESGANETGGDEHLTDTQISVST